MFGGMGERGSGQPAPHVTQQGATTPGQRASVAVGNVAESHHDPVGRRIVTPASPSSIDDRCAEFHKANPHVLEEMLRLARERVAHGATRIGIKSLWEELRERLRVLKTGEYKLNNSYTAIYGRMLVERAPELEPLVEIRRRKPDRKPK